jgi:hypothetical protein
VTDVRGEEELGLSQNRLPISTADIEGVGTSLGREIAPEVQQPNGHARRALAGQAMASLSNTPKLVRPLTLRVWGMLHHKTGHRSLSNSSNARHLTYPVVRQAPVQLP